MQTKTNDNPLNKIDKSQALGIVGSGLKFGLSFIPGGSMFSGLIDAGVEAGQNKIEGDEAAKAKAAQEKIQQAQQTVVDNSAEMNNATASTNLSTKPVYNPNDPYGTGVDPSMLEKRGPLKKLSPITSYYGEAKNLSSLSYRDSILMKTVSGVNTLKKENETDPPNRKVIEDRGRGMGGITQDTITGKFYSQTFPNQEMDSTHIRNPFDPSIVDEKWLPKKDENN